MISCPSPLCNRSEHDTSCPNFWKLLPFLQALHVACAVPQPADSPSWERASREIGPDLLSRLPAPPPASTQQLLPALFTPLCKRKPLSLTLEGACGFSGQNALPAAMGLCPYHTQRSRRPAPTSPSDKASPYYTDLRFIWVIYKESFLKRSE